MRNRLLHNKKLSNSNLIRAVPMAKNFMIYAMKATNFEKVNRKDNKDHHIVTLIEVAQGSAADVYKFLVEAESTKDFTLKLELLSTALRKLDSAEAMFCSIRNTDKLKLRNEVFVATSIEELRTAIVKWIHYIKRQHAATHKKRDAPEKNISIG